MRNKLLKSVAVFLVLIMVAMVCNISFASNITVTNIKNSLEKCLGQDIIIKGSDNSITTLYGTTDDTTIITDSKIGGKYKGEEITIFNYSLADNVCTFDVKIEDLYKMLKVDTTKASKEELITNNSVLAMMFYVYMEELYISVADSVGKNPSLAYTYFEQKMANINNDEEKININVNNDIFSVVIKSNDKYMLEKSTLKINLDNLANLSDSKIDKNKTTYKVFIGQLPDSEKENIAAKYKIDSIKNKAYTGSAIKPAFKLLFKNTETESFLEKGKDFTVSYINNKNTGKATLTVTGIGFYKGTITKNFYIVPKKVTGVKNKTQGKTKITVKWDKATGATGYELEKYDTKKKKYIKVTSKAIKTNSYKVTGLKVATTYKFRVRAYKTVDGKKKYGSYSAVTKLTTKTKTPTVTKLTGEKKKATVKFKKISGASGYQIQYSTDKKFKKNNKTTNVSKGKTSKTVSKLKSKKKYYFRIRAYRTVNGKKIYSSYSSTKNIKIK